MTAHQPYETLRSHDDFEVRRYPEHVLAEITVEASFEDAGNRAFRTLFGYINGKNQSDQKVAMTAPVLQDSTSESIAMTAPVLQECADAWSDCTDGGRFRVSFVLPEGFTLENAPRPTDSRVRLRLVPPAVAAATRFRGRWSAANYRKHLERLRTALRSEGLSPVGPPRFARFDPPYKPWFLRRNEIVLSLEDPDDPPGAPGENR
ncbi:MULTISPECIES: SOUL family heme-binding protein [Citricoccus]|uniref:SOUL family heme-binding protein n=1 Tax=Citricoccus TaxID=169133 RepID=UPI000255DEAB|nr:heme-binding protein [Citricoccus sp. CH26A]